MYTKYAGKRIKRILTETNTENNELKVEVS